ncbi:MAG: transglutaminase-like domain-containing protein [Azoarcus sp.]|nr:transglutaminase-like domain-containing protein [Azoarcus sp.]
MALAKKSGNAFDTASLLIALLRSVGIESRYVYGTVDIPAEQLMNWVGDAKTPDAAQQILEQGGIPNTALNLELAVLASGIAILGLGGGGIF